MVQVSFSPIHSTVLPMTSRTVYTEVEMCGSVSMIA
jgi:hypothetical protein